MYPDARQFAPGPCRNIGRGTVRHRSTCCLLRVPPRGSAARSFPPPAWSSSATPFSSPNAAESRARYLPSLPGSRWASVGCRSTRRCDASAAARRPRSRPPDRSHARASSRRPRSAAHRPHRPRWARAEQTPAVAVRTRFRRRRRPPRRAGRRAATVRASAGCPSAALPPFSLAQNASKPPAAPEVVPRCGVAPNLTARPERSSSGHDGKRCSSVDDPRLRTRHAVPGHTKEGRAAMNAPGNSRQYGHWQHE